MYKRQLLLCVIETVSVFASEKNTQDYLGNMTEELDFSKLFSKVNGQVNAEVGFDVVFDCVPITNVG